jgi:hypothetical protein
MPAGRTATNLFALNLPAHSDRVSTISVLTVAPQILPRVLFEFDQILQSTERLPPKAARFHAAHASHR